MEEFREVSEQGLLQEKKEEEFGDVLFLLINYVWFEGIDLEMVLEWVNQKFKWCFEYIEVYVGWVFIEMSLEEMDVFWNEVKF